MPLKRRILLMSTAILIFIGLWLTGWSQVHWFLYVMPVLFSTFALSGICPETLLNKYRRRRGGR